MKIISLSLCARCSQTLFLQRSRMKTTRSLLNVFSQAPSKSTPISLSPFPTLPTLDPISKLNYDEDHHLQEIKYPLKTDRPEEPYFQMLMTMNKTNPPKQTPIPPEQLFLPSIFVPFLRRGGDMIRTTGPSLKINSQIPPKSMPPISLSFSPSPTLSTQTPIFNINRPFKAKVPPLTRMQYAHEYGIAVEINQDFRTMLEDGSPMYRNLALTLLFEDDMFDVAMAVYGDMLKRNFPRDCMTFNCVIDGLCKAGKMQDAIHLFDEMAAEIGISPNTTTYTNLLNGFCKFHRMDEAFMFLGSFLKEGYIVNLDGYICMIDGLFGTGRFEEACKYYKNLLEVNISPNLTMYRIMIKGYADAGRIDDGFEIVKEMSSIFYLFPDSYCYNIILKYFIDVGLWNMAQLFVKDYILKVKEFSYSPIQEAIMACWLCKAGFDEEAEKMVDKMVRDEGFRDCILALVRMYEEKERK